MRRRARRTWLTITAAAGTVLLGPLALPNAPWVSASTPSKGSVTVPSAGKSVTITWKGTIPPGSDPTSECDTEAGASADAHTITITVPKNRYATATARATFSITWNPVTPTEDTADEILTVDGPGGQSVGSSDGSTTSESVPTSDPPSGSYTALACGFANAAPQPYTGKLTITTAKRGGPTGPVPPATPQARLARTTLTFSHEAIVDNQRDGFEPDVVLDHGGRVYTSVPSGSSTTNSYIWSSRDHGNSYQLIPGNFVYGRPGTCPQGGGDTELQVDSKDNLFFSDLQSLTNLTNGVSTDHGAHFVSSCVSVPNTPVDRMWYAIKGDLSSSTFRIYEEYDAVESSLAPNAGANELVAVVGVPGTNGVEFAPLPNSDVGACTGLGITNCVTTDEGIPGNTLLQLGKNGAPDKLFIAHSSADSNQVQVSIGTLSSNGMSASWKTVTVDGSICPDTAPKKGTAAEICGATEFATIAQDSAGTLYVAFSSHVQTVDATGATTQTGPYNVYVVSSTDHGAHWSKPVQVSRDGTNAFSWITAGSKGRVAVAWYHSNEASEHGSFLLDNLTNTEFSTKMAMSTDADSLSRGGPVPAYQIATVSEHPIKYGPICTQGLGCTVSGGDRSLGDFLEVSHDDTGRLYESFVDDTSGYYAAGLGPNAQIASAGPPVIARQIGGPSLTGGTVTGPGAGPGVPYGHVSDPTGDADYSANGSRTPASANLDLTRSSLSRVSGGIAVHMHVRSLSSLRVSPTLGGTTAQWITRFTTYDPGQNGNGHIYYAGMESVLGTAPRFFVGEPSKTQTGQNFAIDALFDSTHQVRGHYDAKTGAITIDVPFSAISTGGERHGPKTKLYSVTSFTSTSLASLAGNPQGIFNVIDATPPYDYVVPQRVPGQSAGTGSGNGTSGHGGTATSSHGSGSLAFTGLGVGLPLLAAALLLLGGLGWRAQRRTGRRLPRSPR